MPLVSAYLVVFAAALFSAGWALTFWHFYTHIDDRTDREPQAPKRAA